MSGSLLILTGPPGAGKSTIGDILARESTQPSVHMHTDDFYDRYIKSGYVLPWLPESLKQNETVRTLSRPQLALMPLVDISPSLTGSLALGFWSLIAPRRGRSTSRLTTSCCDRIALMWHGSVSKRDRHTG